MPDEGTERLLYRVAHALHAVCCRGIMSDEGNESERIMKVQRGGYDSPPHTHQDKDF